MLLVEKSVSPYAQEILAKEISLVLNMKRPLLERISRCTGAQISSVDSIGKAQLGRCRDFHIEKVTQHPPKRSPKSKTLMFFEGCPRRLGCTVINSFVITFSIYMRKFKISCMPLKNKKCTWQRVCHCLLLLFFQKAAISAYFVKSRLQCKAGPSQDNTSLSLFIILQRLSAAKLKRKCDQGSPCLNLSWFLCAHRYIF